MVTRHLEAELAPELAGELAAGPALAAAQVALDRATRHLAGLQEPGGWWQGELETNVTMDAEDLLLREFLGVRTASRRPRPRAGSGPGSGPTEPGRTGMTGTQTCPRRWRRTSPCGWPVMSLTPVT